MFDVWVIGPLLPPQHDPNKRAELVARIAALHPVAEAERAQFVAGGRLRVRRDVDQDAALRIVAELQAVGAAVEIDANRGPEAVLALDQLAEGAPEPDMGIRLDENLLAKLQPLDDAELAPSPLDASAAAPPMPAIAAPRLAVDVVGDAHDLAIVDLGVARGEPGLAIADLGVARGEPGLAIADLSVARDEAGPAIADGNVARAEPALARAAGPVAHVDAVDDRRFRPTSDVAPMELEVERPPPPAARAPSTNSSHERGDGDDDDDAPPPIATEPEWRPVAGRIAGGALRNNPPVRIAIGIVAGLALGWLFSQPYAHRAERRVAELRAQADAERYRPVDEAQQRVRALDAEADDTASNGALGMGVIWLVVAGGAFAAWWRFT